MIYITHATQTWIVVKRKRTDDWLPSRQGRGANLSWLLSIRPDPRHPREAMRNKRDTMAWQLKSRHTAGTARREESSNTDIPITMPLHAHQRRRQNLKAPHKPHLPQESPLSQRQSLYRLLADDRSRFLLTPAAAPPGGFFLRDELPERSLPSTCSSGTAGWC